MRARQEGECQELQHGHPIFVSERQWYLLAMMERKRNWMSEARKDLRTQIFQELGDLYEKISGEKMRNAEVEEGRVAFAAGGSRWISKFRSRG